MLFRLYSCCCSQGGGASHVGMLMRKPSPVGVTKAPCRRLSGRLRLVDKPAARSWNSGRSHIAGLGITIPTLGKLEKYLSAGITAARSAPLAVCKTCEGTHGSYLCAALCTSISTCCSCLHVLGRCQSLESLGGSFPAGMRRSGRGNYVQTATLTGLALTHEDHGREHCAPYPHRS